MTLDVRYHDLAAAELVEAWEWHEDQRTGLGDRFLEAVTACVDRAQRWPDSGSPVHDANGRMVERKLATHGFPWLVRYRIIERRLVVMAVHHQRRHPEHGGRRIAGNDL